VFPEMGKIEKRENYSDNYSNNSKNIIKRKPKNSTKNDSRKKHLWYFKKQSDGMLVSFIE